MPSTVSLTELGVREAADHIRRGVCSSVALVEACLARVRALESAGAGVGPSRRRRRPRRRPRARRRGRGRPLAGSAARRAGRHQGHLRRGGDADHGGRPRVRPHAARRATAGRWRGCARPAPSSWARPTRRSSRSATRRPRATRGTPPTRRAARRRARPPRSPRAWCPVAIGSQTVGSILRPAAFCGVVGLKGPHGLVPVDGAVPLAWSLDHVGPFARSVEDAALMLSVLADQVIEPAAVQAPRLAVGRQLFDRAEPELRRHLDAVVGRLAAAGAHGERGRPCRPPSPGSWPRARRSWRSRPPPITSRRSPSSPPTTAPAWPR